MKKDFIKFSFLKKIFSKHKILLIFLLLLVFHIFFSFYQLEERHPFGWDQVDNAWAAKNIIVDHKLPLVGMVAKQNTGFFIGPLYYYYVAFFYWIFDLDPIASVFIAGTMSIFSFVIFFFIIKKLFSAKVALIAIFIYTFSFFIISADRVQWPINLLPPISLLIFYFLYKVCTGEAKYIIPLAAIVGFSFHLNFTAIFFPIIILCAFPFFPRNMQFLKYSLIAAPIFFIFLVPNLIYDLYAGGSSSRNFVDYVNTYYHGFHLRRMIQIIGDAFIEFESIITFTVLKPLKFLILPVFIFIYFIKNMNRKNFIMSYLMILWIVIPWIVFSVYKGEISNYYFSLTRPVALITIAFVIAKLLDTQYLLLKASVLFFGFIYIVVNFNNFFIPLNRPLSSYKREVQKSMHEARIYEFNAHTPEAYLFYMYRRNEDISNTNK